MRKRAMMFAVLALLLPAAGLAQGGPDEEASPPALRVCAGGAVVADQADCPRRKPPRIADWKFWLSQGVKFGLAVGDIESTQAVQRRCFNCTEASSWLLGRRPSRARMYLTIFSIDTAVGFATYKLKAREDGDLKKAWFLPDAFADGLHLFAVIHNSSIKELRPPPCTVSGACVVKEQP